MHTGAVSASTLQLSQWISAIHPPEEPTYLDNETTVSCRFESKHQASQNVPELGNGCGKLWYFMKFQGKDNGFLYISF